MVFYAFDCSIAKKFPFLRTLILAATEMEVFLKFLY